jgi:hypothetical protein
METTLTPTDLLAEWLGIHWPNATLEVTERTIVVNWPPVAARGNFVNTKLTLTVPEQGLFKIDDVWICDPNFFAQFELHMNKRYERLQAAVDQYVNTGSLPDLI